MISTFAFLYFYAGWFAAIFLAKTEHAWISLLLPLGMILCFLKLRLLTPKLLALGLATSIFGAVFDSLMSQTKLISVHGQTNWLIPSWLISIWFLFTFSMIGMRSKLRFPNWLAALLGAASGPLSYKSGAYFEVLFMTSNAALIVYSVFWFLAFPIFLHFLRRFS